MAEMLVIGIAPSYHLVIQAFEGGGATVYKRCECWWISQRSQPCFTPAIVHGLLRWLKRKVHSQDSGDSEAEGGLLFTN